MKVNLKEPRIFEPLHMRCLPSPKGSKVAAQKPGVPSRLLWRGMTVLGNMAHPFEHVAIVVYPRIWADNVLNYYKEHFTVASYLASQSCFVHLLLCSLSALWLSQLLAPLRSPPTVVSSLTPTPATGIGEKHYIPCNTLSSIFFAGAGNHTTRLLDRLLSSVPGLLSKTNGMRQSVVNAKVRDDSNPIQDATDKTIACNDDGTSGALQLTATVQAGSAITAYWNQIWPHPYGPMVGL